MTNFWDADGDFDYEAHHEAGQRDKAAATAERIGYPGMTDAFHYFGLHDWTGPMFTPELLTAMDTWQVMTERIGYPGMTDAFHYFGLHDWTGPMFTPELLTAMDTWQVMTERIEATPADQDIKDLQRQAEETARTIQTITDSAA